MKEKKPWSIKTKLLVVFIGSLSVFFGVKSFGCYAPVSFNAYRDGGSIRPGAVTNDHLGIGVESGVSLGETPIIEIESLGSTRYSVSYSKNIMKVAVIESEEEVYDGTPINTVESIDGSIKLKMLEWVDGLLKVSGRGNCFEQNSDGMLRQ